MSVLTYKGKKYFLENCPCCDNKELAIATEKPPNNMFFVYCTQCGMRTGGHSDSFELLKVWNMRKGRNPERLVREITDTEPESYVYQITDVI